MSDIIFNEVPGYVKNETWKKYCLHDDNNILGFFGEYRFLSNMTKVIIDCGKYKFPSVENAYQAMKYSEEYWDVFERCSPLDSKKVSSEAILPDDWHVNKYDYMFEFNREKYKNPHFKQLLLNTGNKYLEETNWWRDTYWGVCNGIGENKLGEILMEIRKSL